MYAFRTVTIRSLRLLTNYIYPSNQTLIASVQRRGQHAHHEEQAHAQESLPVVQMHHCKNVFVTDGSCMTSTATQNPSLTFMAISARAANHAIKLLKTKEI